jgi:hypothetical protein
MGWAWAYFFGASTSRAPAAAAIRNLREHETHSRVTDDDYLAKLRPAMAASRFLTFV